MDVGWLVGSENVVVVVVFVFVVLGVLLVVEDLVV